MPSGAAPAGPAASRCPSPTWEPRSSSSRPARGTATTCWDATATAALGRWFRTLCGDESERGRLETRLRELSPRLLAISSGNDEVIPAPAMLNTLQGLHRDTGVPVVELALGVHEHPFLCPDYEQRDRRFVTEILDLPRYGDGFERFIGAASGLLRDG